MKNQIEKLLQITSELRETYGRSFTLDGRLVGDIGEVLVRENYNVELYPENTEKYDAYEIDTKRNIQIKTSMKKYFSFPFGFIPEFYLAIKVFENGDFKEIYNGPGYIVKQYILEKKLKDYRKTYYSLTLGTLEKLDKKNIENQRIKQLK